MADGIKISELGANGTLDQAADFLPIVQPGQSPKNRKILAQDLLAPTLLKTGNLAGLADVPTSRGNLGLGTVATHADSEYAKLASDQTFAGASVFSKNIGIPREIVTGAAGGSRILGNTRPAVYVIQSADIEFLGGELSASSPFRACVENLAGVNIRFSSVPSDALYVHESAGTSYQVDTSISWATQAKFIELVWDGTILHALLFSPMHTPHEAVRVVSSGAAFVLDPAIPKVVRIAGDCAIYLGNPNLNYAAGTALQWHICNKDRHTVVIHGTFRFMSGSVSTDTTTSQSFSTSLIDAIWDGQNWLLTYWS